MPALQNPKHERFAQALAKGKTADEAYAASGLERQECGDHEGFYVYALIDPRTDLVFYIGKGKDRRYGQHFKEWRAGRIVNAAKFNRIGDIAKAGLVPTAVCLMDGLQEGQAYSLERAFIQAIGRAVLTNETAGQQSDLDKAVAAARYGLSRIKPFCIWMAEKRRKNSWIISPEADQKLYWGIVADFSAMATQRA